jgi:RNA polymerase sigma-70 factor (ECF subfamily)
MTGAVMAGDPEAGDPEPGAAPLTFEALFAVEYPRMVALAAAVSGNRAFAEDIAQEALGRASARWAEISRYDKPGAWLRRVTFNLAVSRRRRLVSEARALLRLGRPEPGLPPALPEHEGVWAAVATLPRQQRAVVALHYLEDRTFDEIAEVLDISPSTVRVHLHRARQTLRDRLDERSQR